MIGGNTGATNINNNNVIGGNGGPVNVNNNNVGSGGSVNNNNINQQNIFNIQLNPNQFKGFRG